MATFNGDDYIIDEFNSLPQYEQNHSFKSEVMLDLSRNKIADSDFDSNLKRTNKQNKREFTRAFNLKILMTFVVLCVAVASVQNVIYIPVFSDYFSPTIEEKVVVKEIDNYVSSLDFDYIENSKEKILLVKVNMEKEFQDFTDIVVEFVNTKTNEKTYSGVIPKHLLSTGFPSFTRYKPFEEAKFQINLYCATAHPEKLKYSDTLVLDEVVYYLIYTHENTIVV